MQRLAAPNTKPTQFWRGVNRLGPRSAKRRGTGKGIWNKLWIGAASHGKRAPATVKMPGH